MRRVGRTGGFTLIELLVVIGIIAVLAAIIMPVYTRARESARQADCISNLSNIGKALRMYYDDYKAYPPPYQYDILNNRMVGGLAVLYYSRYVDDWRVLRCKDDTEARRIDDESIKLTGNPNIGYSSYNKWYNFYGMWGNYKSFAFDPNSFSSPPIPAEQVAIVNDLNATYLPNVALTYKNPGCQFSPGDPLLYLASDNEFMDDSTMELASKVYYPEISSGERHAMVDDLGAALWTVPGATTPPYGSWGGAFPALCNRNAPDSTVSVHCGWHRIWYGTADKHRDLVLRLAGDVSKQLVVQFDWIRQSSVSTE
jgi:prepilin-type N-terminal cleavage/methylation domain-containing protein